MQISKNVTSTNKTIRGLAFTQQTETILLTDNSGNYFIKASGKLTRMSRKSAQEYFQKNFDDFWKYLSINKLYEQFPELYTKEEALKTQQLYSTTPKKKVGNNDVKIYNPYENFISYSSY